MKRLDWVIITAITIILIVLSSLFGLGMFLSHGGLETKSKPCAYQDYKGNYGPGFTIGSMDTCFDCKNAITEEELKACPPEFRAKFLKEKAIADEWQRLHGYKQK